MTSHFYKHHTGTFVLQFLFPSHLPMLFTLPLSLSLSPLTLSHTPFPSPYLPFPALPPTLPSFPLPICLLLPCGGCCTASMWLVYCKRIPYLKGTAGRKVLDAGAKLVPDLLRCPCPVRPNHQQQNQQEKKIDLKTINWVREGGEWRGRELWREGGRERASESTCDTAGTLPEAGRASQAQQEVYSSRGEGNKLTDQKNGQTAQAHQTEIQQQATRKQAKRCGSRCCMAGPCHR